jgi:hypothetical protein
MMRPLAPKGPRRSSLLSANDRSKSTPSEREIGAAQTCAVERKDARSAGR